jgi:hypothetical protein
MVPGFTAIVDTSLPSRSPVVPSVELAGVWDIPKGECRYARTDTFCTGLVIWCREIFICNNGTLFGREESKTPYPCGVCVGVSSPDDW